MKSFVLLLLSASCASAAINFDGTDDHIDLPNWSSPASYTITAWIKRSSGAGTYTVFDWNNNSSVGYIRVGEFTANKVNVFCQGSPNGSLLGTVNVSDGAWHHVAATVTSNDCVLYIDGISDATDTTFTATTFTATNVRIGNEYYSGTEYFPWDGEIESVRIYNRKLSATEVDALYRATRGRAIKRPGGFPSSLTDLVGHWLMQDGAIGTDSAGVSIRDVTGSGNNGTVSDGSDGSMLFSNPAFKVD